MLFGVSLAIFLLNPQPINIINIIISSVIGSYLPDVDLKIKHRMVMHNIFVPIIFSILIYSSQIYIPIHGLLTILIAFNIGFLSHILLDMFTYAGVAFFYPLSSKRYRLAKLRSNSQLANVIFSIIALLLIFMWAYRNKLINTKPIGLQ